MTEERVHPPMHPGRVLELEFLEPLGMTAYKLAKEMGVPPIRAYDLVHGNRSISPNTALRLARVFGTSPEFWMNLQAHYDLEVEEDRHGAEVEREAHPLTR